MYDKCSKVSIGVDIKKSLFIYLENFHYIEWMKFSYIPTPPLLGSSSFSFSHSKLHVERVRALHNARMGSIVESSSVALLYQ